MRQFRRWLASGAVMAALLGAGAADAHARLVTSTPPAGATVPALTSVRLVFSERLTPSFSGLEITRTAMTGMIMDGDAPVSGLTTAVDGKTMVATTPGPLAPGHYLITWHAVSADTHRVQGSVAFTVR